MISAIIHNEEKMKTESKEIPNYDFVKAASKGYTEAVRLLLDQGADINHKDGYDCTTLMHAAQRGYTETAQFIVPSPEISSIL